MYLFKKLLLSFAVVLFTCTCGTSTVYLYYLYPAYYIQYTCCTTSTQYGRSALQHDLLHRPSK